MNLKLCLASLLLAPALSYAQPCNLQPNATYAPDTACHARPLYLKGNATVAGVSYSWTGPNSFSSSLQNPVISSPNRLNAQGNYILSVSKTGCTTEYDTVAVTLHGVMLMPYLILMDSMICTGDSLKMFPTNSVAVVSAHWTWGPNLPLTFTAEPDYITIPNATLADTGWYFTYTHPFSGPSKVCLSDTFKLYVGTNTIVQRPATAPIATITATPGTNVGPWVAVTFRANTLSAGSKPKYQWRKNGINIPGATDSIYTATTNVGIMTGDTIAVWVQRGPVCIEDSVSAPVIVNINLGVEHIGSKTMSIYPNPNNGSFTLASKKKSQSSVHLNVLSTLGQVVFSNTYTSDDQLNITLPVTIPNGMYYLKIKANNEISNLPLYINR